MSREEPKWRKAIVDRLIDRNKRTCSSFQDVVTQSMENNNNFYFYEPFARNLAPSYLMLSLIVHIVVLNWLFMNILILYFR